jgi:hypothetical protein
MPVLQWRWMPKKLHVDLYTLCSGYSVGNCQLPRRGKRDRKGLGGTFNGMLLLIGGDWGPALLLVAASICWCARISVGWLELTRMGDASPPVSVPQHPVRCSRF